MIYKSKYKTNMYGKLKYRIEKDVEFLTYHLCVFHNCRNYTHRNRDKNANIYTHIIQ